MILDLLLAIVWAPVRRKFCTHIGTVLALEHHFHVCHRCHKSWRDQ